MGFRPVLSKELDTHFAPMASTLLRVSSSIKGAAAYTSKSCTSLLSNGPLKLIKEEAKPPISKNLGFLKFCNFLISFFLLFSSFLSQKGNPFITVSIYNHEHKRV